MESIKKYIIAVLVMASLNSCSLLINDSGSDSKYIQKNKRKYEYLKLSVSLSNDTVFFSQNTYLEGEASLKYLGNDYYYFSGFPSTAQMDLGFGWPNSVSRIFFYNKKNVGCLKKI